MANIIIATLDKLPEYCYDCPCHDGENDRCNADNERRSSIYRPFWCPLKEQEDYLINVGNGGERVDNLYKDAEEISTMLTTLKRRKSK